MTTDLWMLVATTLLCLCIPFVYAAGRMLQPGGLAWSAGNRDQDLPIPGWAARAVLAHKNMLENLAPFAVFVLVVHVTGHANAMSALGAMLFFGGRVAHLFFYVAGITYLRTLAWMGSWVGGFMILAQLLR